MTKVTSATDVHFVATLLSQIERTVGLKRQIGIEILIEEVEAVQNVEAIAHASPRVESLILGMGDLSAAMGIDLGFVGSAANPYPGDIWHYARARLCMAARSAKIDAIDGPFPNFRDTEGYRREAIEALALGFVGKWAIHPSQIEPALEVFSPRPEEVARARKLRDAILEAEAKGLGAAQIDGQMVDVASLRILKNTIDRAELFGM
jgi:citrate lyase subunit beta/citryl-CoA lyase